MALRVRGRTRIVVEVVARGRRSRNLAFGASIAGEGDSRVLTGAIGTTQRCIWSLGVPGDYAAVLVAFRAGAPLPPVVVTIGGVFVKLLAGWSFEWPANGRGTLSCAISSATPGAVRPTLDQNILIIEDEVPIFGGDIQEVEERGANNVGLPPYITHISATDYNALPDRRLLNEGLPAGTLKGALTAMSTALGTLGITLDPTQAAGPTVPALGFNFATIQVALEQLSQLTGWVRDINPQRVLKMYAPASTPAPWNITAPGDRHVIGDVTVQHTRAGPGSAYCNAVWVYAGPDTAPLYAYRESFAEISAHGLWMTVVRAETITDQPTTDALADSILQERAQRPRTVTYVTLDKGIKPGMTQTIVVPDRNINNLFLITNVRTFDHGNRLHRAVTATESATVQHGWLQQFHTWFSGTMQSVVAAGAPGTGGGGAAAPVYWLGGSDTTLLQSSGPDWIPGTAGSAVQPIVDSAIGGVNRTVMARLRADAGTVTARLRNVTDGVTVGTSVVVSTSTFQTVVFAVTLTTGSKVYELQLLPSLANVDVGLGSSYLQPA